MIRYIALGLFVIAAPVAVHAQDYQQPALDPYMSGMQGSLIQGLRHNGGGRTYRRSGGGVAVSESNARATCANRDRARARLGDDDPQVQQLYRLCARAGYD